MYNEEKTKALISGVAAMQLIFVFVFRICKNQIFSRRDSNVLGAFKIKEKVLNDLPMLFPSFEPS